MDKADVETVIKQSIYNVIEHPDLAFSNGVETDLGTFYRLSNALVETICDTAWFESHQHVIDSEDVLQLKQNICSMLLTVVGYSDVTGYDERSLLSTIMNRLLERKDSYD